MHGGMEIRNDDCGMGCIFFVVVRLWRIYFLCLSLSGNDVFFSLLD